MKTPPWESGSISVFRWFAALQLAVILLALASRMFDSRDGQEAMLRLLSVSLGTAILLLGYLLWRSLPTKLGKAHLPVGLAIATLGHSLGHFFMLLAPDWKSAPLPLTAAWHLIPLLFVPLVIVAVHYAYHAVTAYCLGTAALDIALTLAAIGDLNTYLTPTFAMLAVRTFTFWVVGYSVVWLMNVQRRQRQELAEANQRLALYAATLDQLATQRERNRIARELHDILAHSLSGLAVHLEGIDSLWDVNPQKARSMLGQARAATESGLAETRRALHALRASPLEDLGLALAIADYAQSAAQRAGFQVALHLPEKLQPLPPAIEQDLYRVAQEAIQNAARHAKAKTVSVTL
ncbi:MAG: sensor histidine kinase, partial [Chloroflexota bacterium]